MPKFQLYISPCPNDTFIFYAWIAGKIDARGYEVEPHFMDIQALNELCKSSSPDIVKVSYSTYASERGRYALLEAGSALGRGCGPLLVARTETKLHEQSLIAIPGWDTTAHALLRYYNPHYQNLKAYLFSDILSAIQNKEVDAGVIIHETRFTYAKEGLVCLQDLGAYWEEKTQLPIPLGAILTPKSHANHIPIFNRLIQESIAYAYHHLDETLKYCQRYAQEMEKEVMLSHINLYVNEFSVSLGEEGHKAIQTFLSVYQRIS